MEARQLRKGLQFRTENGSASKFIRIFSIVIVVELLARGRALANITVHRIYLAHVLLLPDFISTSPWTVANRIVDQNIRDSAAHI